MATTVEFIDDLDKLRRIAPVWATFHQEAGGGPFSSSEWLSAWIEAYGDSGPAPHVGLVWRDERLVAGGLFGIERRSEKAISPKVKFRKLVMLCRERAGYHELLALPGHEDAGALLLSAVVKQGGWQMIDLTPLKSGPELDAFAAEARSLGMMVLQRNEIRADISDLSSGWEGYLSRRSANGRKTLRSNMRDVEAQDHRLWQIGTPGPEADTVLEKVLDLSQLCWKAQMGTDIGTDPRARTFFRALWRGLSARGAMRLNLLEIEGKSASAATTLVENGLEYGMVVDFDETFAAYSPGRYIITQALMNAANRGIRHMDLLRHTDFTERFADHSADFVRLRLCRRFGVAGLWMALEERLRPIGRELRRRHKLRTRKRAAFK